jgi:hypothetical protein
MSIEKAVEAVAEVAPAIEKMEAAMEANDMEAFADAAAELTAAAVTLADEVLTTAVEDGVLEEAEAEALAYGDNEPVDTEEV